MLSRRGFLKGSISTGVLLSPMLKTLAGEERRLLDYFDCGVASGEPTPEGVIIWTRVPQYARGVSGTEVFYEVATTSDFKPFSLVSRGSVITTERWDHTVNIKLGGLRPYTYYYYRFYTTTGYTSEIGRTKTAPEPDQDIKVKFATLSCQDYIAGFYTVYQNLINEDLDFCVHLGDFIYEGITSSKLFHPARIDIIGEAFLLEQYRAKYRLYLSDPMLREARRLFPFIHVWDDHEVKDDYAGTDLLILDRARQGHQAYAEYLPIDLKDRLSNNLSPQMTRSLRFGSQVDIIAMDLRANRDIMPCKSHILSRGCDGMLDEKLSTLGKSQRTWVKDTLSTSGANWKFLLSSVMFMPFKILPDTNLLKVVHGFFTSVAMAHKGIYINFDAWDGYPAERFDLTQHIYNEGIQNVVVCSGDIHSAFGASIYADPEDVKSPLVAHEITTPSITSRSMSDVALGINLDKIGLDTLFMKANKHMKYAYLKHHGYSLFEVTQNATIVDLVGVSTTAQMYADRVLLKRSVLSPTL